MAPATQKRRKSSSCGPHAQKVVLGLLAANLVACMLIAVCLQHLHSGPELEERPAPLHKHPAPLHERPALRPSQNTARPASGAGAALTEGAPQALAARPGAVAEAKRAACAPCSARVSGPLPTTRLQRPAADDCSWAVHRGATLDDVPLDITSTYPLDLAQEYCVELGSECGGITCEAGKPECSLRKAAAPRPSQSGELSYVKECAAVPAVTDLECEAEAAQPPAPSAVEDTPDLRGAALVILAHNREDSLRTCLESLTGQVDVKLFHLYVSLDDKEAEGKMSAVVNEFAEKVGIDIPIWHVEPRVPEPSYNSDIVKWITDYNTAKIAHHYWVAFEHAFMEAQHEKVVFVEEDLTFAPDFLALFRSTAWLLDRDPTLWCVSAWNDNGFSMSFSDACRLSRTTYFPGLGFLLPRHAWLRMREMWPPAPTMGWDYWMRTAFRQEGKGCVIPEVPRSHHAAEKGASVTKERQLKVFRSMALAGLRNTCGASGPCRQFGDVSYLLKDSWEQWLREAVQGAPRVTLEDLRPHGSSTLVAAGRECGVQKENLGPQPSPEACAGLVLAHPECGRQFQWSTTTDWGCRCCSQGSPRGKDHAAWSVYQAKPEKAKGGPKLDRGKLYVLPYTFEEYKNLKALVGLQPAGTKEALPEDIRTEHYGVLLGRHMESRAEVLLVDRRSTQGYLLESEQEPRHPQLEVKAAERGQSCQDACEALGKACDHSQLHYVNDCRVLLDHFPCRWCAHQVGAELPVYVPDETNMNTGQCLVTFISPMKCSSAHLATQRLCACVPK